jgi:hypothetical protein
VFLVEKTEGARDVKKIELHDNVSIVANRPNSGPPTSSPRMRFMSAMSIDSI